jgi:hypothetical protein
VNGVSRRESSGDMSTRTLISEDPEIEIGEITGEIWE